MGDNIDILGLGAACQDLIHIVPRFPDPDEKIDSESESYLPGGVTGNYITAVGRLGVNCAFIGALGDDEAADYLIDDFKKEGVDTRYIIKKKGMKTGVNVILVDKTDGQKMIIISPHFNTTKLVVEDLKPEWFKGAKLMHTTAVHHDLTVKAVEYAKANDVKVSFDLESQIAVRGMEKLKPILEKVDILLPNKLGATTLTKKDNPIDAAKEFNKMGIETVIITMGDKGAIAVTDDGIIEAPAFKMEHVVDATGAGDSFCGAFSYGNTIKKWDLEKSLTFACACAAIKMEVVGARVGMPSLEKAIKFLRNHGHDEF
ncbi:MAG: carbohydrate kinase family protein [archaeon]|nr:carbohydrate kinase family protein [archaeon]